jgi:hypothetical protein
LVDDPVLAGGLRWAGLSDAAGHREAKAEGRLLCVDPARVAELESVAVPLIRHAVGRCGDWSVEAIWSALCEQRMLLWLVVRGLAVEGVVVTRLEQTPKDLVCVIVLCAGRHLLRSRHLIGTIEQFARAEGCARLRMQGRRGWRRVFKDYSEPFITLEKSLER